MGELFNKLDATQRKMMDYYLDHFANGGEGRSYRQSTDFLMREWDARKSNYLYKLLGNNFVVEKEIAYEKEIGKLKDELETALWDRENAMYAFRRLFDAFLWNHRHDLGDEYWKVKELMNIDQLSTNIYNGETFSLNAPEERTIKVQNGCRPVKLIGKIVNAYGELHDEYEAFRTIHSQILNQKMLKGTMCLSILPIDYMTMSDNDSGWSSCMSWKEGGCYCRGTVEMMNSPMVLVGYLKASSDMYITDGLYCANKKWRELFIVNENLITGVKGYPYQNPNFVNTCISWIRDLAKTNLGWDFGEAITKFSPSNSFNYNDESYKLYFETYTMYNDFGSCDHYVSLRNGLAGGSYTTDYSGREECMCCGSLDACYDGEGTLLCDDCCGEKYYCSDCGDRIYEDEMYTLDGSEYCQSCYEEHAKECPISGDEHDRDNFVTLYLSPFEGCDEWSKMYSAEVYRYADEYYSWERRFSHSMRHATSDHSWNPRRYVLLSDINEGYLESVKNIFDLDDEAYDNYLSYFSPMSNDTSDEVQVNA